MAHGHMPLHFPEMTLVCTPDNRAKFPVGCRDTKGSTGTVDSAVCRNRKRETEKQTASQLTQELSTPVLGR